MSKKSITVIPKSPAKKGRRPGRPATGKDPLVALRLPPVMIKAVDDWAARNGVRSRSEAMRDLIDGGLKVPTRRAASSAVSAGPKAGLGSKNLKNRSDFKEDWRKGWDLVSC